MCLFCIFRGVQQELPRLLIDREFCPALGVDNDLKERYYQFFLSCIVFFWLHGFLMCLVHIYLTNVQDKKIT